MSDITVLGLGDMGFALAETLLKGGKRVTVWNRTPTKAAPLLEQGANLATTVRDAIQASPIIITCLADYGVTRSLLAADDVSELLAGKLHIELTTGTPQDARENENWATQHGLNYLDGAILATPRQVGRADTLILVSGSEKVFQHGEPLLRILAGGLTHMGEPVGAASAWDLAFLTYAFGGLIGFLHGVRILESEGIPLDGFGPMIVEASPIVGEMVRHEAEIIQSENYANQGSSVKVCAVGFEIMLKQAREAGIGSEFPQFARDLFQRGLDAGMGHLEAAAIIKVLRGTA